MKYIFEKDKPVGEYPVKNFQIIWYDGCGRCFDELFVDPKDLNIYHLAYIEAGEEIQLPITHSKVLVNMKNGEKYELKLVKFQ